MIEIEKTGDTISLARASLLFNWGSVVPHIRSLHENIYYMQSALVNFLREKNMQSCKAQDYRECNLIFILSKMLDKISKFISTKFRDIIHRNFSYLYKTYV